MVGRLTAGRRACGATLVGLMILAMGIGAAGAAETSSVQLVRVPGGGIQPQALVDARGRVHLIYSAGDPAHGDVYYVHSDDGGATFSKPMRVNSQPESAIGIGTVRGPHLAIGKNGRIHVAWMGSDRALPKVDGKSTPMLYTRLNDAGDAFEPQRNVIQKYAGLDGGGAVAADERGNVYVAWHAPRSQANEADRRVWVSRSRDEGKTFEPEKQAIEENTGACGCCGMNITTGPQGRIFVLYRSATQQVHRDTYLLESDDHAATFRIVGKDPWNIGICAMSTAAFAPAEQGVVAAWETQNQIRFARVNREDPRAPEIHTVAGEGGNRKHPAVAVNGHGDFIIAWAEGTGWNKGGSVAWQVFDRDGKPQPNGGGHADGLPVWDSPTAFVAPDDSFRVAF